MELIVGMRFRQYILSLPQVQQKHIPDEEVARAIASKLDDMSGVSYAEIANGAFEIGRVKLALKVGLICNYLQSLELCRH